MRNSLLLSRCVQILTFVLLLTFHRTLFPTKPELVGELLERTRVDSSFRPNEVGFEHYGKICQSFIEISREHDMPITPLGVRKPVAVATKKDKEMDDNASNLQMNQNTQ